VDSLVIRNYLFTRKLVPVKHSKGLKLLTFGTADNLIQKNFKADVLNWLTSLMMKKFKLPLKSKIVNPVNLKKHFLN
jgi:hypothetical protein